MAKSRTKKKLEHEDDGDPWFNPYRWPASPRALDVVGDVLFDLEKRENRTRKRTAKDRQWLWQVGHVLAADLAYHYLSGSPGNGLVVPRAKRELGKKSRYHPPYFTRSFPNLLDTLQRIGYLRQKKGAYSGKPGHSKRTTIKADARFVELVVKHQVTFEDLEVSGAEEVIILKRAKRGHWDRGEKIPYRDTPTTARLRAEVREVNAWLERADIAFDPSAHDRPVDVRASDSIGTSREISKAVAGSSKVSGKTCRSALDCSAFVFTASGSLNLTTPNSIQCSHTLGLAVRRHLATPTRFRGSSSIATA